MWKTGISKSDHQVIIAWAVLELWAIELNFLIFQIYLSLCNIFYMNITDDGIFHFK